MPITLERRAWQGGGQGRQELYLQGVFQPLVKPCGLGVIPPVLRTSALPRGLWHPILRQHVPAPRLGRRRGRRSTITLLLLLLLLLHELLLWLRRRRGCSSGGVELDALVDRLLGNEMDDLVAFLWEAEPVPMRTEGCEHEEVEEDERSKRRRSMRVLSSRVKVGSG